MDKPFSQNYDECLRYYAKSYEYGIKPGTASSIGYSFAQNAGTPTYPRANVRWPKPMARTPSGVGIYSIATGAVNTAKDEYTGLDVAVTPADISATGLGSLNCSGGLPAGHGALFQWTADTGF
jgi:hypothetical protein